MKEGFAVWLKGIPEMTNAFKVTQYFASKLYYIICLFVCFPNFAPSNDVSASMFEGQHWFSLLECFFIKQTKNVAFFGRDDYD